MLQKIKGCNEKIVPTTLDLDDEVHRIIFDKELQYEPAKLYTSLPIVLPKPSVTKTRPPNILSERKLMGYPPDKVVDSFFWSTISILAIHNCVLPSSTLEYRKLAVKKLRNRKGALNDKIKDFTFNLNYKDYQEYISDFLAGKAGMDPELYLAEALATGLYRPMIFISSLENGTLLPANAALPGKFHLNKNSGKKTARKFSSESTEEASIVKNTIFIWLSNLPIICPIESSIALNTVKIGSF